LIASIGAFRSSLSVTTRSIPFAAAHRSWASFASVASPRSRCAAAVAVPFVAAATRARVDRQGGVGDGLPAETTGSCPPGQVRPVEEILPPLLERELPRFVFAWLVRAQ
jgi:hypothetical protein